jgi:hypothetical protein
MRVYCPANWVSNRHTYSRFRLVQVRAHRGRKRHDLFTKELESGISKIIKLSGLKDVKKIFFHPKTRRDKTKRFQKQWKKSNCAQCVEWSCAAWSSKSSVTAALASFP